MARYQKAIINCKIVVIFHVTISPLNFDDHTKFMLYTQARTPQY